ncbi:unnamed protein product [Sympodiomycopsis kandeliae]
MNRQERREPLFFPSHIALPPPRPVAPKTGSCSASLHWHAQVPSTPSGQVYYHHRQQHPFGSSHSPARFPDPSHFHASNATGFTLSFGSLQPGQFVNTHIASSLPGSTVTAAPSQTRHWVPPQQHSLPAQSHPQRPVPFRTASLQAQPTTSSPRQQQIGPSAHLRAYHEHLPSPRTGNSPPGQYLRQSQDGRQKQEQKLSRRLSSKQQPSMSNFDVHGGLAALRSQILSSDGDTRDRGPYTTHTDNHRFASGAPQLPRIQTNLGSSFDQPSDRDFRNIPAQPSSPYQRESAESSGGGSFSGHSGPSTALTTPSASLDTKSAQAWSGSQQRISAASSSRGSNSAFAYSDQLSSPGMAMTASFGDAEDTSFGSASETPERGRGILQNEGPDGSGSPTGDGKGKGKKANPLQDLIETEIAYVAELSKIIKKVAAAWSRQNLPPAELDTMFRNIESIYRVNRTFLKMLKEIGPNPSSPRALGDLLMRWIDDLEDPYVRYCENCFTDFDTWPGVQSNKRLTELLVEVSAATGSDGAPVACSDKKRQPGDLWTLDSLFALPQTRLKYYKKLYARLLKSTHSGRSDHRLLVGANEKLDELLEKSKNKISVGVLDDSPDRIRERANETTPTASISESTTSRAPMQDRLAALDIRSSSSTTTTNNPLRDPITPGGDIALSPVTPGRQVVPPPLIPPVEPSQPISPIGGAPSPIRSTPEPENFAAADDLERTLDMTKVLDLFTMQPKKCQLRINPPTLPFQRGLRKSSDVVIDYVPLSTGQECIWRRGHIFLLTDLFLICDRMTPAERSQRNLGPDGMWLLFPPLAGKHLKVSEAGGAGNALNITILKKETIKIHVQSRQEKDEWLAAFEDCNKFATNMGLKLKTGDNQTATSNGSAVSPAIAVTPSPQSAPSAQSGLKSGETSRVPSLQASVASTLDRAGSFNSVASFPKAPASADHTPRSSDPHLQAPIGALQGSPRSASPGLDGPFQRGPANVGGPRPGGFPRPAPPGNVGSPTSGPMGFAGNGRPPMGVQQGGPRPGMPRPPPPGPYHMANGRPPFRPPGPPGAPGQYQNGPRPQMRPPPPGNFSGRPAYPSSQDARDNMRRPSAPNLRDRSQGAISPPVRTRSASSMESQGAPKLPSEMMKAGSMKGEAYSPPSSPKLQPSGPTTSTVSAQMRCRLYLKQSHAQWKSLGNARLKLYHIMPADHKQLVVENDKKMLISTIVLTDGVERVGKVGVAVEVSDNGNHTGIIYMLQMRSEESAQGLFGELIDGGGRTVAIT